MSILGNLTQEYYGQLHDFTVLIQYVHKIAINRQSRNGKGSSPHTADVNFEIVFKPIPFECIVVARLLLGVWVEVPAFKSAFLTAFLQHL